MNETLQSELASADPAEGGEDAIRHALVGQMSRDAQRASIAGADAPVVWWRRRRVMVPLGVAGIIALTGAVVLVPLQLSVNDTAVDLDAEIPIVYTTDNGVDVSCRFGIYIGDPVERTAADDTLAEFVEEHDWDGIGQRIYDEAIAHPFVPGPDDDWEVDSQEIRDSFSFHRALDLIWQEIPAELQADGQAAGSTSDCTGRLR
jgi:hypothetical protein